MRNQIEAKGIYLFILLISLNSEKIWLVFAKDLDRRDSCLVHPISLFIGLLEHLQEFPKSLSNPWFLAR